MKKNRALLRFGLSFFFFSFQILPGQSPNDAGLPLLRNFTSDDYGAYPQNWAAVQDSRGVMYFGNGTGILEFDGRNWSLIPVSNNALIRSLGADREGTVYWGASGDFGLLSADAQGKILPVSLLEKVKPEDRAFNDVWKTLPTSDGVYFLTSEKTFRFHDGHIDVITEKIASHFGFQVGDTVLLILQDRGLAAVRGNEVIRLPQTENLESSKLDRICGVPFAGRKILLATRSGAFFIYNLEFFRDSVSGRYDFSRTPGATPLLTPFACEASDSVTGKNKVLLNAARLDDNHYALTTLKGGVFIIGREGRLISVIDKNHGLQDDGVRDLFRDRRGNAWLPLNNGLAYIEFGSPLSQFNALNGLPSYLMAATRFEDRIYAGTFGGVFRLAEDNPTGRSAPRAFLPVENCSSECGWLEVFNGALLAATNTGVYSIRGLRGTNVYNHPGVYCLGTTSRFPHHVFLGGMDGLGLLETKGSGAGMSFIDKGTLPEIKETIHRVVQDGQGNLWLMTQKNGVYCLKFNGDDPARYEVFRYGTEQGLPQLSDNYIEYFENRLLICTQRGIFEAVFPPGDSPDLKSIRFVPERTFGEFFLHPPIGIVNLMRDRNGTLIVNSSNGLVLVTRNKEGIYQWDQKPFRRIPPGDVAASVDEYGILWVPTNKGLFRYDFGARKESDLPFNALIRKVMTRKKAELFAGAYFNPKNRPGDISGAVSLIQPETLIPVLPYEDNGLAFEYSAAFFEPSPGLRFKHILEKFDKEWSDWAGESRSEYTNLPEGAYTFRVKARNIYERESEEAAYRFVIKPPWFRTIPAFLGFIVVGALGIMGIVKGYTFRIRRDKARLEKIVDERTQELKEATLTDPLTGLRNRRYLTEILRDSVLAFINDKKFQVDAKDRRNQNDQNRVVFGLFMCDIDHFKSVNDAYGHEAGNRFLRQFARTLNSTLRGDDDVMRIGGEEFLIVLKETDFDHLNVFAQSIMTKIRETGYEVAPGAFLSKTCSIGYTAFPIYPNKPGLIDFEQALMITDLALYHAKSSGRNSAVRILATEKQPESQEEIRKMVSSLPYALKNGYLRIDTRSADD